MIDHLEDYVKNVAQRLRELGVEFALVGGIAVSLRTIERFTKDVDFAISVEGERAAEAVVRSLNSSGFRIAMFLEREEDGRLATVRLRSNGEVEVFVDLLFATSGIENEVIADDCSRHGKDRCNDGAQDHGPCHCKGNLTDRERHPAGDGDEKRRDLVLAALVGDGDNGRRRLAVHEAGEQREVSVFARQEGGERLAMGSGDVRGHRAPPHAWMKLSWRARFAYSVSVFVATK